MSQMMEYFQGDEAMAGMPAKVRYNEDGTFTLIDKARGIAKTFSSVQESIDDEYFGECSDYMRSGSPAGALSLVVSFATVAYLISLMF